MLWTLLTVLPTVQHLSISIGFQFPEDRTREFIASVIDCCYAHLQDVNVRVLDGVVLGFWTMPSHPSQMDPANVFDFWPNLQHVFSNRPIQEDFPHPGWFALLGQ